VFRAIGDGAFHGGIAARVEDDGALQSVDWRIHTIGPGRACVVCLDALRMSDVSLDRSGKRDDPD
jgi:molybdopterin-synthase adenylyltransferase